MSKKESRQGLESRRKELEALLEKLSAERDKFQTWKKREENNIVRAKERAKVLKNDVAEVDAKYREAAEELNGILADINAMEVNAGKIAYLATLYGANHMGDVFAKGAFSQSLNRMGERLKPLTERVEFNPNPTHWLKAWLDAGEVDPEKKLEEKEELGPSWMDSETSAEYLKTVKEFAEQIKKRSERKPYANPLLGAAYFVESTNETFNPYNAIDEAVRRLENMERPRPLFLYAPDPDPKPSNYDALRALLSSKGEEKALRAFFGLDFGHADESVTVEVSRVDDELVFRVIDKMKDAPEEEEAPKVKTAAERNEDNRLISSLYNEGLAILEKIASVKRKQVKELFSVLCVGSLKELCDVHREGFSRNDVERALSVLRDLAADVAEPYEPITDGVKDAGRVRVINTRFDNVFLAVRTSKGRKVDFKIDALEVARRSFTHSKFDVSLRMHTTKGGLVVEETRLFIDSDIATMGRSLKELLGHPPIRDFVVGAAKHAAEKISS